MGDRSARRETRNPILALPGWKRFDEFLSHHPMVRRAFVALLRDIAADARVRAEQCWKSHKAPMAAYWKAVSVYSGHVARALNTKEGTKL